MSDGLCSSVDRTNERMNERTNDRASTVTLAHAPRVNEEYLRNPRQFYSTSFLHDVLATEANS